jgi:hypothetical protein
LKPIVTCFAETKSGGSTCSAPARAHPRSGAGESCEYRFKNPSLGKTLMINQAADPSAATSSGRGEGVGGRGAAAAPSGVAFRGREESRSRRRPAGRALATRSQGWAGAGRGLGVVLGRASGRGAAPGAGQQAAQGRRRRARGLRAPEPRCEAAAPPARARTMGAPLAVALGALHYLALFLQLGGATRPAGHTPWDNHVSGHGEFGRHPHGLPHQTPPQLRRSNLATRGSNLRWPWREPRGAPCWVCGPTLAPWPTLWRRGHPSTPSLLLLVRSPTHTHTHTHTHTLKDTHTSTTKHIYSY